MFQNGNLNTKVAPQKLLSNRSLKWRPIFLTIKNVLKLNSLFLGITRQRNDNDL